MRAEPGRLDVLVHAAGITADAMLWKMEADAWRRVMAVNVEAAFLLLHGFAPLWRAQGGAAVVLVSSINGARGKVGQANYAASKAALEALGKTAAREMGRQGVRVNVVAPGWIDTDMTAGDPGRVPEARARRDGARARRRARRRGERDPLPRVRPRPVTSRARSCAWTADR